MPRLARLTLEGVPFADALRRAVEKAPFAGQLRDLVVARDPLVEERPAHG
jgi:hypothetical protein